MDTRHELTDPTYPDILKLVIGLGPNVRPAACGKADPGEGFILLLPLAQEVGQPLSATFAFVAPASWVVGFIRRRPAATSNLIDYYISYVGRETMSM